MLAPALERPANQLRFSFGEEHDQAVSGDTVTRALLGAIDGRRNLRSILDVAERLPERPSARNVARRWVEAAGPLRAVAALAMHLPL